VSLQETPEWLDSHPGAEKEDYEEQQKKLEELYNPIVKKVYEGEEEWQKELTSCVPAHIRSCPTNW